MILLLAHLLENEPKTCLIFLRPRFFPYFPDIDDEDDVSDQSYWRLARCAGLIVVQKRMRKLPHSHEPIERNDWGEVRCETNGLTCFGTGV